MARIRFQRVTVRALLFVLLPFWKPMQGVAEEIPGERIIVAGVRVGSACVRQEVRITGFAAAREETAATLTAPGFRISEILVWEGDKVTANQDLLRASREGSLDATSTTGKGSAAGGGGVTLRSPIAGTVVKISIRVGDITGGPVSGAPSLGAASAGDAAQSEPHFLISTGDSVDLVVDIPSVYASRIRKGATARVVNDEGVEAKGVVQAPAGEIEPLSQLGRGRLSIEPSSALRPGQFASAIIETEKDCGIVIPLSAINYRDGQPTVQILKNDFAEMRTVNTGLSDGVKIRIKTGLVEGDIVAMHAGSGLRSGDHVAPILKDLADDAQ